jgi:hypothetical protein
MIERNHILKNSPPSGARKRRQQLRSAGTPQGRANDPVEILLHLQRTAGNRAVSSMLRQSLAAPAPTFGEHVQRDTPDRKAPPHPGTVGVVEIPIDGAGDQQKELLLRFKITATEHHSSLVSVEIIQVSSNASQHEDFEVLTPWGQADGDLFPMLSAVSDGKVPTAISLVRSALNAAGDPSRMLLIYPPELTENGRDYRIAYQAEAAGKSAVIHLPKEAAAGKKMVSAGAVSTVEGMGVVDDFPVVDLTMGAAGDTFRAAVQPIAPDKARFSIAAVQGNAAEVGHGVEIALNGPLSLHVVQSGPTSVGLDLNGDGQPDIQIFDELDTHTGPFGVQDSDVSRYHKVRVTGPAVGTDVLVPFQVQQGQLKSAVSAIGGITAIDIALGAFSTYGHRYRLTFQPSGPDKARLGISTLERDTPEDSVGAEITLIGALSVQLIDMGLGKVGIDLNDDKKPELEVSEVVTAETEGADGRLARGPFLAPSYQRLHVAGSALGADLHLTFTQTSAGAREARASAMAVDTLAKQVKEGGIQRQIDATESAMVDIRARAAKEHIIQQPTLAAWFALSEDLIKLEPGMMSWPDIWSAISRGGDELQHLLNEHRIDEALKAKAAADAHRFIAALTAETGTALIAVFGAGLPGHLEAGNWGEAFKDYEWLVNALDSRIIEQLKEKGEADAGTEESVDPATGVKEPPGSGSDKQGQTLTDVAEREEWLRDKKGALREMGEHNAKRLLAAYYPDEQFETVQGYVAEVPLMLYYWNEPDSGPGHASTWHLKNITNPQKPHDYTVPGNNEDRIPPESLLHELNDPDHFSEGRIHYQLAEGRAGELAVTSHLTWKQFWEYLGLGLMVVSLVLVPEVGLVQVASEVAFAVAAGIDLKQKYADNDLDVATAVLDIGQIVMAFSGMSARVAGRLKKVWAGTTAAAGAETFFVAMTATHQVAGYTTLAVMSLEAAKQMTEIELGPGTRSEKDRAEFRLIAQLAAMGYLTAMHVDGKLLTAGEDNSIRLLLPEGGGPPIAELEGQVTLTQPHQDPTAGDPATQQNPPVVDPHIMPGVGRHVQGTSLLGLGEPPVRIVTIHDAPLGSAGYEGSGARVYRGQVETATGTHEAAIKLRADDQSVRHPDPDLRGRVTNEVASARAAHATGYGPEVYGVVEVPADPAAGAGHHGGSQGQQDYADPTDRSKHRLGFAMGIQEGGYYDAAFSRDPVKFAANEAEAGRNAARVNDRTLAEYDDYAQKLLDGGHYYKGEVQGLVGPNGEFKPIDFETIKPLPAKGTPEYDEAVADHRRNVASERTLISDIVEANRSRGASSP